MCLRKALTLPESTTIFEACRRRAARKVDALLLTNSNGLLCGILTDRDITTTVVVRELDIESSHVSAVITKNPNFVISDTLAVEAFPKMVLDDVVQDKHLNKMNSHNIVMVFAPNMTQMVDPLTALMYAVKVMNVMKTLINKTLRDSEILVIKTYTDPPQEPSVKNNRNQGPRLSLKVQENCDENEEREHSFTTDDDRLDYATTSEENLKDPRSVDGRPSSQRPQPSHVGSLAVDLEEDVNSHRGQYTLMASKQMVGFYISLWINTSLFK
ncbi:Rho GTPase-activating protein 5-like protein, partial [Tanacetum coccineum]